MRQLTLGDVATPSIRFKLFASPQARLRRHAFLADDQGLYAVGNVLHDCAGKGQVVSALVLGILMTVRIQKKFGGRP